MATKLFNLSWLKTQTGRDLDSDVNSTTLALGEKADGTQGAFTFFQGIKNFFKGVTALGSLTTSGKLAVINTSTGEVNYVTAEDLISFGIDNTTSVVNKTWSSSKIDSELKTHDYPDYSRKTLLYNGTSAYTSTFTAPADGLLSCSGYGETELNSFIYYTIGTITFRQQSYADENICNTIPVKKGTTVSIDMHLSVTNNGLFFVYNGSLV